MFNQSIRKFYDFASGLRSFTANTLHFNENLDKAISTKTKTLEGYYRFADPRKPGEYPEIFIEDLSHVDLGAVIINGVIVNELQKNDPVAVGIIENPTSKNEAICFSFTRHSRKAWYVGKFFACVK